MNKITHSNMDLVSKILSDKFGNKSFAVYGLDLPEIAAYLPTELPSIDATDRISDRIFKLVDGSYAIVDFESDFRRKKIVKYMTYAARLTDRYIDEEEDFKLRFIIIYTGDVQSAPVEFDIGGLKIKTEQAFLSHIDGDEEFEKIRGKIEAGEGLDDEDLMKLIILPLTYKGEEKKVEMIDRMITIAKNISDEEKKTFVLAGICVANDNFITQDQADFIGGLLSMTKVGQKIWNDWNAEKISYGNEQKRKVAEEIAKRMLESGDSIDHILDMTGLTLSDLEVIKNADKEFAMA